MVVSSGASFVVNGIDVVSNPAVNPSFSGGQDDAGFIRVQNGQQPFPDNYVIEFTVDYVTADGELTRASNFTGIKVYESEAARLAGTPLYTYSYKGTGNDAQVREDLRWMGDTYVRFNATQLVSSDPNAPKLTNLLLAPGTNANDNLGSLFIDRHVDSDFDRDGMIDAGTIEDGNGLFFVGYPGFIYICFTPGTMIATPQGERAVETLRPGDRVWTRDNGAQPISWTGLSPVPASRLRADPSLRPVIVRAGSLGPGLPERDLMVSPAHRLLITGASAALLTGESEVLAAAHHLVGRPGIERAPVQDTAYVHFLCARHEVVLSNGAWTESFQAGDYSLAGMASPQRDEILRLFPELAVTPGGHNAARKTLKRHEARLVLA